VRVVAVAVADEGPDIVACAEAGLSGFVPRDGSLADTVAAIMDATQNELRCSPRISAVLFKRLSTPAVANDSSDTLTPRESEVVALIDRGLSNKQIAGRLQISEATVKNHVHNILEKLHVERRSEAAAQVRSQRTVKTPLTLRRVAASSTNVNRTG
ncbi:MAG: response regulator transcription factor, partial [Gemmatimonadota bacterium]|nr:response regulator transcription factor [Gemmatimonadota bacterium]